MRILQPSRGAHPSKARPAEVHPHLPTGDVGVQYEDLPQVFRPEPPSDDRLKALQRLSGPAYEQEVLRLYEALVKIAGAKLRGGWGRGMQAESVAHDALIEGLPKCLEVCRNDDHLEGLLVQYLNWRIADRRRKRRPGQLPQHEGSEIEPAVDHEPGPASIAEAASRASRDRRGFGAITGVLISACVTQAERTMVELFVMRGHTWASVGRELGKTEGAAKTAFARLRERLLAAVLTPCRDEFTGPEWAVADMLGIRRLKPASAAKELGITEQGLQAIFRDRVVNVLKGRYGEDGLSVFLLLLGAVKRGRED